MNRVESAAVAACAELRPLALMAAGQPVATGMLMHVGMGQGMGMGMGTAWA